MRKKFLVISFMTILCISGCAKKSVVNTESIATTEETTVATSEVETESTETEAPELIKEIFIPEAYEVFTDGEPHQLLYYADAEHTYFDAFTSVNRPDLGIMSVSFPSIYTDVDESEVIDIYTDIPYTANDLEDFQKVLNYTTTDWHDDNGFCRGILSTGRVGLINKDFPIVGDTPSPEEVYQLAEQYVNYTSTNQEVFVDTSEDGNTIYSAFFKTYPARGENVGNVEYFGLLCFRIKDGKAEGAYIAMRGDLEENIGYLQYMMKSLRFTD